jgi:hypothetical protein
VDLRLWVVLGAQKIPPNLPFSKGGAHSKQHAEAPPFAKGGLGGFEARLVFFVVPAKWLHISNLSCCVPIVTCWGGVPHQR